MSGSSNPARGVSAGRRAARQARQTSDDTRERILVSALAAFAAHGFDGAKTRDIAQKAGVNLGLLQYHFGGKGPLWRASVDRAFEKLKTGLEAVLKEGSSVNDDQRARLMVSGYVRFVAQNPEFVRLMHDEGKRNGPRMCWLVDKHVKPMFDAISMLLERSTGTRFADANVPPIHLHYILAGSVGLIFHQSEECTRLAGVDAFAAETIENHVRAVEYFLLGPPNEEIES